MASSRSNSMNTLDPSVSFLLGMTVATVLMLFYLSVNPTDQRSLEEMAWINRTQRSPASNDVVNKTMEASLGEANNTMVVANEETPFQDLLPLLKKAATDDKTIIMTSVNEAYAAPNSLLDAFLESFRFGEQIEYLLQHLIIVALDPKAFERCKSLHRYCYLLSVNGNDFSSEVRFMSKDYVDLVWSKLKLQRRILQLGYNFLFTDADIMWLRNPLEHISVVADMTTSSDTFYGDPTDIDNKPNTGLFYVKSTATNAEMLKYWYESKPRFHKHHHEQSVLQEIKRELVDRFGVKIRFISTDICGGFCHHGNDLGKICTMHANCCIGLGNKLQDLRGVLEDWKNYTALTVEERKRGVVTWRVPGKCIH